jgi:uridine kinase
MPVENRIVKVQKRNRALVTFDQDRIRLAILHAAQSIGGFREDHLPGINDRIFQAWGDDEAIAGFLADVVVICLNSDPHHLISNFPPTIEMIQDEVLHALRSHGFQNTADAYACYRWGRHWLREGAVRKDQFAANGFPTDLMADGLAWNRAHGCDTIPALNEITLSGRLPGLVEASLARYESALDAAADRFLARLNAGDRIRMLWVSGPSSSGKTTTTVKLTQRLQRHGLRFLMLNLDDYFWSLIEHPTDWINDRNFETPEALDIQLLNRHLRELLDGQTIQKPIYSFKEGRRLGEKPVRLEPDQVLLLDCLHGFYPPITEGLDPSTQFRLYIETMNMLFTEPVERGVHAASESPAEGTLKRHECRAPSPNAPPPSSILHPPSSSPSLTRWTDIRLLRRTLRDVKHRNHSPLRTLLHWHYVRHGELFSIIPLRGLADAVINGGFPFDLPVLKPFYTGPDSHLPAAADLAPYRGFLDARIRLDRVRRLLDSVAGVPAADLEDTRLIPGDAVLREFIGGSTIQIPHNE